MAKYNINLINKADFSLSPDGWRVTGFIGKRFIVTPPVIQIRFTGADTQIVTRGGIYRTSRGTQLFSEAMLDIVSNWDSH